MKIEDFIFNSAVPIDKVVATFTGSFTVPAPTSDEYEKKISHSISTNIPESTFFQLIYSIDGGTTWSDSGFSVRRGNSDSFYVIGRSNANTFTVMAFNLFDYSADTGFTRTVQYKLVLFEKTNQGEIPQGQYGGKTYFDSRLNYQKIKLSEARAFSVANNSSAGYDFAHNLGYIPRVRVFIETNHSFVNMPAGMYNFMPYSRRVFSADNTQIAPISMSNTNLNVRIANLGGGGSVSGTLHARIYHDA